MGKEKSWYQSTSLQGVLIAFSSWYLSMKGYNLEGVTEAASEAYLKAGELAGIVMAGLGRLKAKSPIAGSVLGGVGDMVAGLISTKKKK